MSHTWHAGKPSGTLFHRENGYTVSFSSPKLYKFFGAKRYKSHENAQKAAEKFRYEESRRRGSIKNMYRRCIDDNGLPYYQVKSTNGKIFMCDVEDIELVDTRIWSTSSDKFPYVFSRETKNEPNPLVFHIAICGKCRHLDKDKLNNRRSNLQSLDVVPPNHIKTPEGVWLGGKTSGSISRLYNSYLLRFSGPVLSVYFPFKNYENEEAAFIAANDYRYEESDRRGILRNRYRYLEDSRGDYLEVMLTHGKTLKCDVEDLPIVEGYTWHAKSSKNTKCHYVVSSKEQISFHRLITSFKVVDHIDGDGLNNRKYNLREGEIENPRNHPKRKDNNSGMTGVSYSVSKNAWIVQWSENGKRRHKSFSVYGDRSNETAKMMAIAYRECLNERLAYHIQQGRLET